VLQQIQAIGGLQQLLSQAWLPLEHEPHDPAAPPSAVPPALRHQLHQSEPIAGLPGRAVRAHGRDLIGPVVADLDPDPGTGPVHGHDDLPACAGRRMGDGVGDQLAGQQDGIVSRGAPAEDLADEQPRPPYLVT